LWRDNTFVDFDHNLNNAINKLREALNDSSENPRFIETVPRRGYRFVSEVEVARNAARQSTIRRAVFADVPKPSRREAAPADVPHVSQQVVADASSMLPKSSLARALFGLSAILLISASGFFFIHKWRQSKATAPSRIILAVLPFENLTGDASQDYLCDGMTEELIAELGGLDPDRLGVIARTTAMHYKGTKNTVKDIGLELGAAYVLESSIRRVDTHIRVTTQLIQVSEQRHLWARSFDRDSSDILGLQEGISSAVAKEIPLYLGTLREAHFPNSTPPNSEAYTDYLKGRFFWNKRTREGLETGVSYFKQAIKEDPQYAPAYAGLADSYLVLGSGYLPPHQTYLQGKAMAADALALDDNLAAAHTSLAYFKFIDEWDWPGAEKEFLRAIAIDPNYATAHHWYALYLSAMSRQTEAINEIEKALELDPFSTVINSNAGAIYYQSGKYDKSHAQMQRTLELDPNFIPALGYLGYIYQTTGDYGGALAEYIKAQQISGDPLAYVGDMARIYALTGKKAELEGLHQHLLDLSRKRQSNVSAYTFCLLYESLGNPEESLKWLAKSIDEREFTATEVAHDLRISTLRRLPEFHAIVGQFNLTNQTSE
jgi:TolB-like protein/Tfp pilus assembly protein PilF